MQVNAASGLHGADFHKRTVVKYVQAVMSQLNPAVLGEMKKAFDLVPPLAVQTVVDHEFQLLFVESDFSFVKHGIFEPPVAVMISDEMILGVPGFKNALRYA